MKTFIDLCVADILSKHCDNIENTTIVFPSKRAILFFKESLGKQISSPIFLPKMCTIYDFCISKQNSTIPDDFTLIYLLYKVYCSHKKNNIETFEDFYPWGEMLLSDFDDIDKYKINADEIFRNIADIKEIENLFSYLTDEQKDLISRFWDTTKIETTKENTVRRNFIEFWNMLPDIYSEYKKTLLEKNFCYEGMALRSVVESTVDQKDKIFGTNQYIFIGFNALSKCEMNIFEFLKNRQQASFYWDYDVYYKNKNYHEAGFFIRKNLEKFKNELLESEFANFERNKNIKLIKTPNEIAQAKLLTSELFSFDSLNNTAVILADEKLIVPILKSLPSKDKDGNSIFPNITLGYPLRSSAAYTLFETILDLCANKQKDSFYYKDVIRICENPIIPKGNTKNLHNFVINNHQITLSQTECTKRSELKSIFNINTNLENYVQSLIDCILSICEIQSLQKLEKSIFYTIYTELSAITQIIKDNSIEFQSIKFINRLLKNTLQGRTIAIEGQPLKGVQVMGILETRMLDFKNIIMTSVTDNNLPKISTNGSFIPYNLRLAFGIPTKKEQSAMYAYYFYRLIQRCENLTLMYNETSIENKSEKSRYILQLLYESPFKFRERGGNFSNENKQKTLEGITIEEKVFRTGPQNDEPEISIKEDIRRAYFDKIKEEKLLSPSALTKYIQCPRKFYLSEIMEQQKPTDIDEIPNSADIGTYIHKTLEYIYKGKKEKEITEEIISSFTDTFISECISKALKNCKAQNSIINPESKEFIMIQKKIKKFLDFEKTRVPFTIIATEEKVCLKNYKGLNIGGIIDRMDLQQGIYRIIDYKTGKCKPDDVSEKLCTNSIDSLFKMPQNTKQYKKEMFQILLYAYIQQKTNPKNVYRANIIFTQAIETDKKLQTEVKIEEKENFEEFFQEFEKELNLLLDTFINDKKYYQTKNDVYCKYCDFENLCGKVSDDAPGI